MSLVDRNITVGFVKNYPYPDLLRQSEDGKGKWRNWQFYDLDKNPQKKVDVLVALNHPEKALKLNLRKGGKLILIQEPPYEVNSYLKLIIRHFDFAISGFKDLKGVENLELPAALPWHVNKSYSELKVSIDHQPKSDKVSWITSSNNMFPGHQTRLDFIKFMKQENFDFDLFGRGFNPIDDKYDGISPYKYSFCAENYIAENYFTEKILDVFLSGSMPIYYGCSNVKDYFPEKSFISIDMKKPAESLQIVKDAIKNDLYSANKKHINEAKNLILNEYQFFPFVQKTVCQKLSLGSDFEQFSLRPDGLLKTELAKKRIRKFIGK